MSKEDWEYLETVKPGDKVIIEKIKLRWGGAVVLGYSIGIVERTTKTLIYFKDNPVKYSILGYRIRRDGKYTEKLRAYNKSNLQMMRKQSHKKTAIDELRNVYWEELEKEDIVNILKRVNDLRGHI